MRAAERAVALARSAGSREALSVALIMVAWVYPAAEPVPGTRQDLLSQLPKWFALPSAEPRSPTHATTRSTRSAMPEALMQRRWVEVLGAGLL